MTTKYWVGGDGNWSSVTNWRTTSGGAIVTTPPGSLDGAVLDANSGTSIVTVDSNITIQTLTCTGFTGTLAFGTNTISLNSTATVFIGATTMSVSGTPLIILNNATTTASRTINATAVTEANSISFNITAGSGTASITVTGSGAIRDLNFTGFTGSHNATSYTMYGSLTLGTGMTVSAGSTTTFAGAIAGTRTITTNSVTFDKNITFNSTATLATDVIWQLNGALTSGNSRACTLTAGTLDLNTNTLSIGQFSSSNANVRTLAFGSNGYITLTSASTTGNITVFTTSDSTNFTVTGTDSYIGVSGGSSGFIRTFTPGLTTTGGTAATAISFYFYSGTDTINLGTANRVFKDIKFLGFTGNIAANAAPYIYGDFFNNNSVTITGGTNAWVFKATSNVSILSLGRPINNPVIFDGIGGSWFINDGTVVNDAVTLTNGTLKILSETTFTVGSFATSGTNQKYLQSTTAGVQATISDASGVNSVSNLIIQDIAATGGATWNAFYDLGNINNGNNTGWYFGDSPTVGNEITMRLRSFTQPRRF